MVKKKDSYRKLEIIIAFIGLILISFQIGILIKQSDIMDSQTDISNKQTEILERTTQSNRADLILIPIKDNRYYSYKLEDLDEPRERESIHIGIINQGKTMAPIAIIKITDKRFDGEEREEQKSRYGDWEIRELSSLNYTSTSFWLQADHYDDENFIRNENLSVGEFNVTFSIDCPYCENPYKEENITICIFSQHEKIEKECGKGWNP